MASHQSPPAPFDPRDFDLHFKVYHELMLFKIQEILLVSSPYDAYIMEEDGSLAAKLIHQYRGLNLSRPPRITQAASLQEALAQLERKKFDLTVIMPNPTDADMNAASLGTAIQQKMPGMPLIMLTHTTREAEFAAAKDQCDSVEDLFVWTGDSELLLALVKSVEDRLNAPRDTRNAMVRVLILVEDAPLYRSFFLPLLYKEVVRQTQDIIEESVNESHRLLKMRARPKILVAENFEKAMLLFNKYKPYVFGVISDTRFPKDCMLDDNAGMLFLAHVKGQVPYLPLLLLSTDPSNRAKAEALNAKFLDKNASHLSTEIRNYFLDCLGFGDFVFRQPDGSEIGRAANLRQLEEILPHIPDEPIYYQAQRNRFSNWIMARSEIGLASKLSKLDVSDFEDTGKIRQFLMASIHMLRRWRQQGAVVQFNCHEFDPQITEFVKIGRESLGGKARGLAFMANLLRQHPELTERYPEVTVQVPQTLVVATDAFDAFLAENHLEFAPEASLTDAQLASRFSAARLPAPITEALAAFLTKVRHPLAVRSSSLWEDAYFQPYTDLYKTLMLPNCADHLPTRLEQLDTAVKLVYASTFFQAPRSFANRTAHQFQRDSMAVIVQKLAGSTWGRYFYPAVSGIARSHNYYPVAPMQSEDGVARLALGMSGALSENSAGLRFCPRYPQILPQFSTVDDILHNAQQSFWALNLDATGIRLDTGESMNLELRNVDDAAGEYPVSFLCSVYLPAEHRIRDTGSVEGVKVPTFAHLLKYNTVPLPALLADLLELGRKGMGCPVEFEFCLTLDPNLRHKAELSILQIKPLAATGEFFDVHITAAERSAAFCFSRHTLGHGVHEGMADIVYVPPATFEAAATRQVAAEIGPINKALSDARRPYLLVGPGRWGSFDPWLGIPVKWPDISGVGAMVEVRGAQIKADPSHGSHFFQQITACGVHYLAITEGTEDVLDVTFLDALACVQQTRFLRHVRLPRPFVLKNDGRRSQCVLLPPS